MTTAIGYVRVRTSAQGRSGLGLEAQRAAIARFAEAAGLDVQELVLVSQSHEHVLGAATGSARLPPASCQGFMD